MRIATQIAGPDRILLSGAVDDLDDVLARLAAIGFEGVELTWYPTHVAEDEPFDTYFGYDPGAVAALLDEHGLEATGSHVLFSQLRDRFDDALAFHRAAGVDALGIVEVPEGEFENEASVRAAAAEVSELRGRLAAEGLELFVHNHDHEFEATFGERTGFEILVDALDDDVPLQVDLSHVARTGHDPFALLDRLGDRVASLHLSDMRDGADVVLGEGEFDLDRALAFARDRGMEWAILEEKSDRLDDPDEVMAVMEYDHDHLRSLLDG